MAPDRQLEESRLQGFDRRLAAALHEVPVPAGLADRLLARLQPAATVTADSTVTVDSTVPADAAATQAPVLALAELPATVTRIATRRRKLWALSAAAAVLIAAGLWGFFNYQTQAGDAPELAAKWFAEFDSQLNGKLLSWRASGNGPSGFQVPSSIRVPARGWMPVNKIVGAKGVAYDLGGDGRTAVLFVVQMPSDPSLRSRPPVSPQVSTGGWTIGVWQSGGLRYVLVVSGDVRAYRDLIDSSSAPFAWMPLPKPRSLTYRAAVL